LCRWWRTSTTSRAAPARAAGRDNPANAARRRRFAARIEPSGPTRTRRSTSCRARRG
jgi:hypothetical protein